LQTDIKIADTVRSALQSFLGATAYEVISLHIKSRTGKDFSHAEILVGNVRVLEEFIQSAFRCSATLLLDKVGNNLVAAFSLKDNNSSFQYSQIGDLSSLVDKIVQRNDSLALVSNAPCRDHFIMNYTHEEEFLTLLVTFLQRGIKNKCINVIVVTEDEKRQIESFLNYSKNYHHDQSTVAFFDNNNTLLVTDPELIGDLNSVSSLSFQPFANILNQATQQVTQKQMSGLNIVGTIAGRLYGKGRFEECLQIENMWHETIRQFSILITLMCTYEKPIDEPHRTHFAECHGEGIYDIS
jgi:DcmR-like sensory protein